MQNTRMLQLITNKLQTSVIIFLFLNHCYIMFFFGIKTLKLQFFLNGYVVSGLKLHIFRCIEITFNHLYIYPILPICYVKVFNNICPLPNPMFLVLSTTYEETQFFKCLSDSSYSQLNVSIKGNRHFRFFIFLNT